MKFHAAECKHCKKYIHFPFHVKNLGCFLENKNTDRVLLETNPNIVLDVFA